MASMLELITRNFFGKKTTRLYPINTERAPFERSRGRIVLDTSTCILCGICSKRCPADAITVDRKAEKWELNAFRCIICGECVSACPKKSISMSSERRHSEDHHVIETMHVVPPKPAAKPAAPKPAPAASKAPAAEADNKADTVEKKTAETETSVDKDGASA